jgi:YD repeat-containing protein
VILPDPATGDAGVGPTVTLTYDGDNNPRTETDPDLNTTTFAYTLLDQLASTSETVALYQSGTTTATTTATTHNYYDNLGNLTETVDADGRMNKYVYNDLDQRTQEQ